MAIMVPEQMLEDNGSYGEKQVFEKLRTGLSSDYTVFHSLRWKRMKGLRIEEGEADFVVFHPEKGMISIEVKSGGVECDGMNWTYIRTNDGHREPMKNPMEQADNCKFYLSSVVNKLLEGKFDEGYQKCWVSSAVWFPSIYEEEFRGKLPADILPGLIMYRPALENPQKCIDDLFEYCQCPQRTNLSKRYASEIVRTLAPHFTAVPTLYSKRLNQEENFVQLTRAQNALLDYLEEQETAAIKGTAGTGKTMLALEKARRLAKTGKVLFICYNKFLRAHLLEFQSENRDEYGEVSFYNVDALEVSRGASLLSILEFPERYDMLQYKHVIIDEAQDIKSEAIKKFHELPILNDGSFYVFYDDNQYVQGDSYQNDSDYDDDSDEKEDSPSGWLDAMECRLVLSLNCRNTLPIACTSGKPIGLTPKTARQDSSAEKPGFTQCESNQAALKKISSMIDMYRRDGRFEYPQICILTTKTEDKSILAGLEKIGNHKLLSERGTDGVLFTTARKFKGLESDVVIIVDVDASSFATNHSKMMFYVGASRAKHFLEIVFVGDKAALESVAGRLGAEKMPTPAATIKRCFEVVMK